MKTFTFDTLPPQLSELVIANISIESSLELLKVNKKLRGYQLYYGPFKMRKVRMIRLGLYVPGQPQVTHREDIRKTALSSYEDGLRKWIGTQYQSIVIDGFSVNDLGLVRGQETPSHSYLRHQPCQTYLKHVAAYLNYSPTSSKLHANANFSELLANFPTHSPPSPSYSSTSPYQFQSYYDLTQVYGRPLQHLLRSIKGCVRLTFENYTVSNPTHSFPLKLDVVKELCYDDDNLKEALDLIQPVVTDRLHLRLPATFNPVADHRRAIEEKLCPTIKGCKELSIWNSDKMYRQALEVIANPKSIWLWFSEFDNFKQAMTDVILQDAESEVMLSLKKTNTDASLVETRRWLSQYKELEDSSKRTEIFESLTTHLWMDRGWLSRQWDWIESRGLEELMDLLSLGKEMQNGEVFVFENTSKRFAIVVWASWKRIYFVRFFPSF